MWYDKEQLNQPISIINTFANFSAFFTSGYADDDILYQNISTP